MKVLVNGGLNLSELDGWWAEAHAPEVRWALGDGREHGDDPAWDAAEAEALYGLLEREVAPAFYARDGRGVPRAWVERMRESMARLTPRFSANRAVREYTGRYYLPAAAAYRRRAVDTGALGAELVAWRRGLARHWPYGCGQESRVRLRGPFTTRALSACLAEEACRGIRGGTARSCSVRWRSPSWARREAAARPGLTSKAGRRCSGGHGAHPARGREHHDA